jgi:tRNA A37 threonylcarbamoyladenosine dehydratase
MIILKTSGHSLVFFLGILLVLEGRAWVLSQKLLRPISLASSQSNNVGTTSIEDARETEEPKGYSEDEDRRLRFGGIGRLYEQGEPARIDGDGASSPTDTEPAEVILRRLKAATVAVVGLGGIGSWAAEALCRSAVGNLVLIDLDDICISNMNRQVHAMSSTVGAMKIDEMKRRLKDINPDCNITLIHDFISVDNVLEIIGKQDLTALVDAIDGGTEKAALLAACADLAIPVVTCGGTAGRKDPTKILCGDINRISGDKLVGACRKYLRKDYGFDPFHEQLKGRKRKKWYIDCVYSTEESKQLPRESELSSFRLCDGALGTACFVTGTAGFVAAARIVDMIAEDHFVPPRKWKNL